MKFATDSLQVRGSVCDFGGFEFSVLYFTIPVRDLLPEFKHRLFKICLFLN